MFYLVVRRLEQNHGHEQFPCHAYLEIIALYKHCLRDKQKHVKKQAHCISYDNKLRIIELNFLINYF